MRAPVPRGQAAGTACSSTLNVPAFLWCCTGGCGCLVCPSMHGDTQPGAAQEGGYRHDQGLGLTVLSSLLFQKAKQQSHTEEAIEVSTCCSPPQMQEGQFSCRELGRGVQARHNPGSHHHVEGMGGLMAEGSWLWLG